MMYVTEWLCKPTNEVWYGVKSETVLKTVNRLRNPYGKSSRLSRAVLAHGVDKFVVTIVATYATQLPAIQHANRLIMLAINQGRSLNTRMLTASIRRNARI